MEWGPNGVVNQRVYKLSEEGKKQLTESLKVRGYDAENIASFVVSAENSLSYYHGMREIMSQCKPAQVRSNLESMMTYIEKLGAKLNTLDTNSRLIVNQLRNDGTSIIADYIVDMHSMIRNALEVAREYPNKGALIEYHKRNLGYAIADAVESILGGRATKTRDGLFEECMAIVLGDITGKTATGIHTLIEKIIDSRVNKEKNL